MLYISHRGNLNSINPESENKISYIQNAIDLGYDVEIDVRLINNYLFLGHDSPDYPITIEWLLEHKNNLWIHCKNFASLSYLVEKDVRTFYHQKENHTIINNCNKVWSHELSEADNKSIIPLLSLQDISNYKNYYYVYGVCSDFISNIKVQDESLFADFRLTT